MGQKRLRALARAVFWEPRPPPGTSIRRPMTAPSSAAAKPADRQAVEPLRMQPLLLEHEHSNCLFSTLFACFHPDFVAEVRSIF